MSRHQELDILAGTLEQPQRALLRAALVAQKQGRLNAAARVAADLAASRSAFRWCALLLALEASELRQGGAVAYTTPQVRYASSDTFPLFEERWGAFTLKTFPDELSAQLELTASASKAVHSYLLTVKPTSEEARHARSVVDAVSTLIQELEAHLGVGVKAKLALENEPRHG